MADAKQYTFSYQELAELMARELGLKEGLWLVYVRFGIGASNVGASNEDLKPTALVPILELGLQRAEEPSNLTIDAGEIGKAKRAKRQRD